VSKGGLLSPYALLLNGLLGGLAMRRTAALVLLAWLPAAAFAGEQLAGELRVGREAVFAFAKKPEVWRNGDRVSVSFESKGWCDATVVVENAGGRILRHLASGVLGPKAPPPFKPGSRSQTVVWDGKDDLGRYVDDKRSAVVRVSLGLAPRFERSLLWHPQRRASFDAPLFAAAPEGVYVFSGGKGLDSVVLYDRDGRYLRTVYPFPAGAIEKVRGLKRRRFPQDGRRLPLKMNFLRSTMLTGGTSASSRAEEARNGRAASAMALRGERLALAFLRLNRLATDGTTGGLALEGPVLTLKAGKSGAVAPSSAAFSPDGRTLYLSGYHFGRTARASQDLRRLADIRTLPVVMKLEYLSDAKPVVFKGVPKESGAGKDKDRFNVPGGIDVDAKGRVYVADYLNDRVQIFSPGGRFLKSIKTPRPADVAVHRRTGEIVVSSFWIRNIKENRPPKRSVTVFGPFENPRKKASYGLSWPEPSRGKWGVMWFAEASVEVDSWSRNLRIWTAQAGKVRTVHSTKAISSSVRVLEAAAGRLKPVASFARDCEKAKVELFTAPHYRQRLYADPASGRLYVAEADWKANGKSFHELIEIDPRSGRTRKVQIPFNAEDMCFDLNGLVYLRSVNVVARYH